MAETLSEWVGVASLVLALAGCIYVLAAAVVMQRLAGDGDAADSAVPGVTVLKPLSGVQPGLYEDLASFCDQDYSGPFQVLFGVQSPDDTAVALVERLVAEC